MPVHRDGIHFRFTNPCPYCGVFHVYDAARGLGHRAVHCVIESPGQRKGYVLYEVGPSGLPMEVLDLMFGELRQN